MKLQPIIRTGAAVALLAAVAACTTVGPNYSVPPEAVINRKAAGDPFISAREAAFQANGLPAKWWHLYGDDNLDRLIEKAFAANTDLRIASANLARARAVLDETEDARHPAVGISARSAKRGAMRLPAVMPIPKHASAAGTAAADTPVTAISVDAR